MKKEILNYLRFILIKCQYILLPRSPIHDAMTGFARSMKGAKFYNFPLCSLVIFMMLLSGDREELF